MNSATLLVHTSPVSKINWRRATDQLKALARISGGRA